MSMVSVAVESVDRRGAIKLASRAMSSRVAVLSVVLFGSLCGTALALETVAGACAADCDDNRIVTVDEVVVGVNIAFNRSPMEVCPAADSDGSGRVGVGDLVRGVLSALHGCPCGETPEFAECGGQCPDGGACAYSFAEACKCISPSQPCGDTAPACNGECPTGTFCAEFGEPFENDGVCRCVPEEAEPCGGQVGMCGGWCPDETGCGGFNYRGLFSLCACLSDPCPPGEVRRIDLVPGGGGATRCVPVE